MCFFQDRPFYFFIEGGELKKFNISKQNCFN